MISAPKAAVLQGTLDLLVLTTLDTLGPLHGFGIARRIQQVSQDALLLNQRHPLSRALAARATRMDSIQMGCLRQQSPRPLLLTHTGGEEAARGRSPKLGAHGVHHHATARWRRRGVKL